MADVRLKHTGAVIDAQIDRVLSGAVVTENTDSEVTPDGVKPVSGKAVAKELAKRDATIAGLQSSVEEKAEAADVRKETIRLQSQINNVKPIEIVGDVTNAPDEEDITTDANNLLKLKDRPFGKGLGYKILRADKTFAEQVADPYTIYEVRYDFDLGGNDFGMPTHCSLLFNGGKLSNGTIIGDSTSISAKRYHIFDNVAIEGSWAVEYVYSEWFGLDKSGNTDISEPLRGAIALAEQGTFIISSGVYLLSSELVHTARRVHIIGDNATIKRYGDSARWKIENAEDTDACTCSISGLTFDGQGYKKGVLYLLGFGDIEIGHCKFINSGQYTDADSYMADGLYIQFANKVLVHNCTFDNCKRDGLYCGCAKYLYVDSSVISRCQRFAVVNDGSQGDRAVLLSNYTNNEIDDCDGGLHAENKVEDGYEGVLYASGNVLKNLGKGGGSYLSAIVSGNKLHAQIVNNTIINFNTDGHSQRAIGFSNPLSIKVSGNAFTNVNTAIVYSGDTIRPSSIDISGNIFTAIKGTAIRLYDGKTSNTIISNNTISIDDGVAISLNLCSTAQIVGNVMRSTINSGTSSIKGIEVIMTPTITIAQNICSGIFERCLGVWTDSSKTAIAYNYIRMYTVKNNTFENNVLFDVPFEMESQKLRLISPSDSYKPKSIESFAYTTSDICNSGVLKLRYSASGWFARYEIASGLFSKAPIDAPRGTLYYCTDLPNRAGSNGQLLIATGNYSLRAPDGAFYTSSITTKYQGTTAERPANTTAGFCFFDTTLGKPIWKSSKGWVDATGTVV